ncbi:MAG TPA: hypothetical protein VEJ87_15680 [Acidimicrobiales bacterium]|nr:hypothetical protein [Acidimicrobiales bacterium]
MASTSGTQQGVELNTTMVVGGALFALLGSFLIALGVFLGGAAVLSAARRWVRTLETPPSETFRRTAHQLRHASAAGVKAWNGGVPAGTP